MGAELFRKYVSSSVIICYRSVVRHPFLMGMVIVLVSMYRLFPLLFSFLVSASPVIVSTAVLLGTLLSYGQPNIPEIEKEAESDRDEIRKLESKVTSSHTETVGRDGNFASEEINGSRIEVGDKSFGVENSVIDDNPCVEVDRPLNLVDDESKKLEFGEEHLVEEAKNEMDEEKVVLGSHYSPLHQSEDEHIMLESDDKLWEGSADPLNSDPDLLWKRVEGDDSEDDEESDSGDSGSDLAESLSPDASMANIIPMLDELHPLLADEQEISQPSHMSHDGTNAASEHSLESSGSSSESNDDGDVEKHEGLEVEDDEDKESKHADKEDEIRSAITWTEDDQKNLMNLGTSELERNRRLENLIARRRARKIMRMQAEKNLIDLEIAELSWNIPPISTARNNPFDYDSNDNVPGSAPSVLLQRRNPFDLPYDASEEKPDLVGDTFQQEFAAFQSKEPFFRRHESFNVGPSIFGASRSERQETKLRPYFVPERIASDGSFSSFQRQFSGLSDSKLSSVPDTESVSSASDLENKDHIEDDHSLEAEVVSEKDHVHPSEIIRENPELIFENEHPLEENEHVSDHSSHGRPYFVPEQVASDGTSFYSFQRQLSEVSDSKVSSVPDTESVSSAGDLENKDHIEDDHSLEAEVVSEKDHEHPSEIIRENSELISENENTSDRVSRGRPYFVPEQAASDGTSFYSFQRQLSEVSDSKVSSVPDTESVSSAGDLENKDHIEEDISQEAELISIEEHEHVSGIREHPEFILKYENASERFSQGGESSEGDGNLESIQVSNDNELDEAEIGVGSVTNQQASGFPGTENATSSMELMSDTIHLNLYDQGLHSRTSSLSSSYEIYNEKEGDEMPTSVPETTYNFVDRGNIIERSDTNIMSLLAEERPPVEPIYDSSPRSITRNVSSSSISNDLQSDMSERAQSLPTSERTSSFPVRESQETVPKIETDFPGKDAEFVDSSEADVIVSRSITEDSLLDMDASKILEKVQVPSLNSHARSQEAIRHEEDIYQQEETFLSGRSMGKLLTKDPEEMQDLELEQGQVASSDSESQPQKEFSSLDISPNEPSEENPEVLQVQITSNNLDNLQIQETKNNVSLNFDSVLCAEPDLVEVVGIETKAPEDLAYISEIHSTESNDMPNNNDDVDEINDIDENLLVELDAIGDFSVKDEGSTSNEMKEETHVSQHDLEIKRSTDEDSRSNLNEMKEDLHYSENDLETIRSKDEDFYSNDGLEHVIETQHSGDEDSSDKGLGSTLNETREETHVSKHDLEIKRSANEDSKSTLNEMKENPHYSENDLETIRSKDEDFYSNDGLEHVIETQRSGDEDSSAKDLGSTLNEVREETHVSKHDLEIKRSANEDSRSTLNEMKEDPHPHYSEKTICSKDEDFYSNDGLEHVIETQRSEDEDTSSKDLRSTLNEMKDPHALEHDDLDTKRSGDEASYSMDLGSTINETKQNPHESEHELETNRCVDEDSYSKDLESTWNTLKQDPHGMEHGLETFYSIDELAFSKVVESTLNEMKQGPQASDHDLETNRSGDEDSNSSDPSETKVKLDPEVVKSQNEKEISNIEFAGASEAEPSISNTDKE